MSTFWRLIAAGILLGAVIWTAAFLLDSARSSSNPVQLEALDATDTVSSTSSPPTSLAGATGLAPPAGTAEPPGVLAGPSAGAASAEQPVVMHVAIPAIGVDAPVVEVGFAADGQLDVPRRGGDVGWYTISSRPGGPGTALLGGHRDWAGDLAVFVRLSELRPGDLVTVARDGREYRYRVQAVESVRFDTPLADILGATGDAAGLTLFTCGGEFDRGRGEYDERVVVYAARDDGE